MKIAVFSDNFYPELGGVADTVLIMGVELAKRGHQIEYFVPAYNKKDYIISGVQEKEIYLHPNIKIHRNWSIPYPTATMQGKLFLPRIWRGFFDHTKFDAVHSHSFFGPGLDALFFSRIRSIPLIGTNHTLIEAFLLRGLLKAEWLEVIINCYIVWYYNHCSLVSTPSSFLLDKMIKRGLKLEALPITNPVEPCFFKARVEKSFLKNELGLSDFTILYVGRLSEEKNPEVLIRSYVDFVKKYPNTDLIFVGHGSLRQKLEKFAKESGASKKIKFAGPFTGENKKKLYDYFHASDVFVTPSLFETQSMSTIQAMASGLPVIASSVGPLLELVSPDRGFLFNPGDSNILSQKIEELYLQPELRKRLGLNAKNFAMKFSVEKVADEWERIYSDVINKYLYR